MAQEACEEDGFSQQNPIIESGNLVVVIKKRGEDSEDEAEPPGTSGM